MAVVIHAVLPAPIPLIRDTTFSPLVDLPVAELRLSARKSFALRPEPVIFHIEFSPVVNRLAPLSANPRRASNFCPPPPNRSSPKTRLPFWPETKVFFTLVGNASKSNKKPLLPRNPFG